MRRTQAHTRQRRSLCRLCCPPSPSTIRTRSSSTSGHQRRCTCPHRTVCRLQMSSRPRQCRRSPLHNSRTRSTMLLRWCRYSCRLHTTCTQMRRIPTRTSPGHTMCTVSPWSARCTHRRRTRYTRWRRSLPSRGCRRRRCTRRTRPMTPRPPPRCRIQRDTRCTQQCRSRARCIAPQRMRCKQPQWPSQ